MELTARESSFLRLLLEEGDYRPIGYFAQLLGVTDRTLRDDVKDVDGLLSKFDLRLERKPGRGIRVEGSGEKRAALRDYLSEPAQRANYLTPEGRRVEILRAVLSDSRRSLSIQRLSEQYFVSRTSIVNDLRYVEEWLSRYDLTLERGASGTRVKGNEGQIRRAFASLIEESGQGEGAGGSAPGSGRIDQTTMESLLRLFRREDVQFLEELVEKLERRCGCFIGDPYYLNLVTHLLICIERVSKGSRMEDPSEAMTVDVRQMTAYEQAQGMAEEIEDHFGIRLGDAETYYIFQYLVSFGIGIGKGGPGGEHTEEDPNARLTEEIMQWVSSAMGVNLGLNDKLENELRLHLASMKSRMKYDIRIKNKLLEEVRRLYPELLAYLEGVMWVLGKRHGFGPVSLDETAYIAMYCQVAVERQGKKRRILVICQSGYGTSQLLHARIMKSFPNWEVEGAASVREILERDLSPYSLLISTVPLPPVDIPSIVISALLSERDIAKIKASGLLSETDGSSDWRSTLSDWRREGLLETTEDRAAWEGWLARTADTPSEKRKLLSGGRLEVLIRLDAKKTVLRVFHSAGGDKALLEARDLDAVGRLLPGYYQMIRSGCDWMAPPVGELRKLLRKECVLPRCKAGSKEEVIAALARRLREQGVVEDTESFVADVMEREEKGCTAIGEGIALPHGRAATMTLAMAVLEKPVLWYADEGGEEWAEIVVLFAVDPEEAKRRGNGYIMALESVCTALDNPARRKALLAAHSGGEALDILERKGKE